MILGVKNKIIVAVTNDISTDERVNKVCNYLGQKGFDITVYGRKLPDTFEADRSYSIIRKKHFFNNHFLFYAEYNIRLFGFLLKNKSDFILANDLDTLLACYLASRINKCKLVYDSHEYFTEVPELQGRVLVRKFWLFIEKNILPKLKRTYTVSHNIAIEYHKKYGILMEVIRNVPLLNSGFKSEIVSFPTTNKTILYQGVLSEGRGLKPAIESLKYLEKVDLIIIGYGKVKSELIKFTKEQGLDKRVHFLGRIPYNKLHNYTKIANIGLILEEPKGQSFEFSLPNKLFDYVHNELPIVASPLKGIKNFIETYEVGVLIKDHNPKNIAKTIDNILHDKILRSSIIKNQIKLKKEFCWEKESKLLDKIFD